MSALYTPTPTGTPTTACDGGTDLSQLPGATEAGRSLSSNKRFEGPRRLLAAQAEVVTGLINDEPIEIFDRRPYRFVYRKNSALPLSPWVLPAKGGRLVYTGDVLDFTLVHEDLAKSETDRTQLELGDELSVAFTASRLLGKPVRFDGKPVKCSLTLDIGSVPEPDWNNTYLLLSGTARLECRGTEGAPQLLPESAVPGVAVSAGVSVVQVPEALKTEIDAALASKGTCGLLLASNQLASRDETEKVKLGELWEVDRTSSSGSDHFAHLNGLTAFEYSVPAGARARVVTPADFRWRTGAVTHTSEQGEGLYLRNVFHHTIDWTARRCRRKSLELHNCYGITGRVHGQGSDETGLGYVLALSEACNQIHMHVTGSARHAFTTGGYAGDGVPIGWEITGDATGTGNSSVFDLHAGAASGTFRGCVARSDASVNRVGFEAEGGKMRVVGGRAIGCYDAVRTHPYYESELLLVDGLEAQGVRNNLIDPGFVRTLVVGDVTEINSEPVYKFALDSAWPVREWAFTGAIHARNRGLARLRADGTEFSQSAYDPETPYNLGDRAEHEGARYISMRDAHTGQTPSEVSDYWALWSCPKHISLTGSSVWDQPGGGKAVVLGSRSLKSVTLRLDTRNSRQVIDIEQDLHTLCLIGGTIDFAKTLIQVFGGWRVQHILLLGVHVTNADDPNNAKILGLSSGAQVDMLTMLNCRVGNLRRIVDGAATGTGALLNYRIAGCQFAGTVSDAFRGQNVTTAQPLQASFTTENRFEVAL
ncbi:MAG: hypothetical protein AAGI08_03945 [Bacteroidota bacterium]